MCFSAKTNLDMCNVAYNRWRHCAQLWYINIVCINVDGTLYRCRQSIWFEQQEYQSNELSPCCGATVHDSHRPMPEFKVCSAFRLIPNRHFLHFVSHFSDTFWRFQIIVKILRIDPDYDETKTYSLFPSSDLWKKYEEVNEKWQKRNLKE